MLTLFSQTPEVPFLAYRRPGFLAGCGFVLIALLALFLGRGLNLETDPRGGVLMEVRVKPDTSLPAVRKILAQANVGYGEVQTFGAQDIFLIRFTNAPLTFGSPVTSDTPRDVGSENPSSPLNLLSQSSSFNSWNPSSPLKETHILGLRPSF